VICTELRAEIVQNKKFEVLNDEKLTSHFVSLTKIKGQDATISDICDDQESMFANSSDRSNYIKNFFGDLYKKPNDTILSENCISEFLEVVSTHERVVNAKLNEEEKFTLDQALSLAELDKSINEANMKSAPGPDGLTNPFIFFGTCFMFPCTNMQINVFRMESFLIALGVLESDLYRKRAIQSY
jgi:hypothetical protein